MPFYIYSYPFVKPWLTAIAPRIKWPQMPADLEKLLTVEEAMAYLGIGRTTIQRWMKQRKIGFVRVGRKIYFTKEHLESFVRENTVSPVKSRKTR